MKCAKTTLTALLAGAGIVLAAQNPNLMPNGNFEGKGGCWNDFIKGVWKSSLFVEEGTGNKCWRMELATYLKNSKGTRKVGGSVAMGTHKGYFGVAVKPDTEYELTFSLKTNIKDGFSVYVTTWDEFTSKQWIKSRKRVNPTPKGFIGNDKEWTRCQARFRTGGAAKTAAVHFQVWGDESQQRNFNINIGDYIMIDNVELREVSAAK